MAWELINPAMQIFIYWLIVGISMCFFVNQGVLEGTKSITSKYNHVAKMNFPLSIIPSYIVFSKFYGHIFLLLIVMVICFTGGYKPYIYITISFISFLRFSIN